MKSLIWKLGLFFLVLLFGAGQLGGCSCSPPTEVTSLVLIDDTHQNVEIDADITDSRKISISEYSSPSPRALEPKTLKSTNETTLDNFTLSFSAIS